MAVQHSHSGKIGLRKFLKNFQHLYESEIQFYGLLHTFEIQNILLIDNYIRMPPPSKFKKRLQAQAALARCSRTSLAQSATPSESIPTSPSSPTVFTTPSNTPDAVFEEESNQETFENVCLHLPDTHDGPPEPEEDGYHTDDDLSELEDEELEESLKKQREGEIEHVRVIQDVFDTLMREVNEKEWKKAESNRSMGYGSKSSEMDGCLQGWKRYKGGPDTSKEVWQSQANLSSSSL